jgi:hypothetical protein
MNRDTSQSRCEKIIDFFLRSHMYIGMWALGMWIIYANYGDRLENAPVTVISIAALAIMLGIMTMIITKWIAEIIRWILH